MASGKKVFTKAGEYLAEFLLTQENKKEDKSLIETLDKINSTSYSGPTKDYMDSFSINKEQLIEYFKAQLLKELNFYNITDGTKEILIQEATQKLFNDVKYLDVLTQAQFEALSEMTTERLAHIFQELGLQRRKFTRFFQQLAQEIANLMYKPLDYFIGGENDKTRIYYRFDAGQLLVSNGQGNAAGNFREIFKVNSIVNGTSYSLGDTIVIGGTEANSPFTKLRFTKEIHADKNIVMGNGAELIGTALKARYADLAEFYTANVQYPAGTLLQMEIDNKKEYQLTIYDPSTSVGCFGVVSYKPGFILNHALESEFPIVPIVMTGQTPVDIVGRCRKGDYIYPSPTFVDIGKAVAVKPEDRYQFESKWPMLKCIGQALETDNYDESKKVNCRIF